MRKTYLTIVTTIEKVGLYLSMTLAMIMALHVSTAIIARYFFNYPFPGTIEIVSFFYMVAVSFLPLGYCQANEEHISADAFAVVLPKVVRPYTEFLGRLLSVAAGLILLVATTKMAIQQTGLGEAVHAVRFDIPVWIARWLVPLGLLSMITVMLAQMFMPNEFKNRHGPTPTSSASD